ncbi:hypothetical protein LZ32DRAFT_542611, partial [Colletotrichum eremochloae]
NITPEPIPAEPTAIESPFPSSNQSGFNSQTFAQPGFNPQMLGQCKFAADGHCCETLALYLKVVSSEHLATELRLNHGELLRQAITKGPRFVSTFQVCCNNESLLLRAANRSYSVETLEFLLSNTRFRQEDGCRITEFVEHLGNVIICLMLRYSSRRFNSKRLDDGKQSLRLLLRAGTQNAFARNVWHESGLYRNWLLGVFNAAAASYKYASPNRLAQDQQDVPPLTVPVPVPAMIHFVECIIEIFPNEDAPFWTAILRCLWTHPNITSGTLRRLADVTLQLLDLGASKQVDLPNGANGGNFLACVSSGLDNIESADIRVDDIEATIEGNHVIAFDLSGQVLNVNTTTLCEIRNHNIERLKRKVLSIDSHPEMGLGVAINNRLDHPLA